VEILEYAIRGIPTGCVFALLAVGLVLTYKTSGVFNLAYGAQAFASAACFFVLRKEWEWPLVPAALVAIAVVGPAIGLLLERTLFRYLRGAGAMAKLVTSLGLLIAIPEIVRLLIGQDTKQNPPPLWWVRRTDEWLWPEGGRFVLDAGQVATIVSTVFVVVALVLLFSRTDLGLRMRAVVESARMAELHGVDSERVSMASWALSSLLAGLAGVLVAPLFASLNPIDIFTLLVAALAATVVGGLTSIPLTFVGGIGLGVLQAVLAGTLPTDSVLASGLRPALPFVVLFLLLVFRPGLRSRESTDPMAAVDPPPPAPVSQTRPDWMTLGTRGFGVAVVAAGLWLCIAVLDAFWLGLVISGVVLGVIMLSITVTTGLGGMLSLSPAAFAAIGAFACAQIVDATGMSVVVGMFFGAAVAAVVGGVLAVPIVRLGSVYLALATLAFALMFEAVLVPLGWVSGGAVPLRVPRPLLGPVDLADDRWFLLFAVLCLAVVGIDRGCFDRDLGNPFPGRRLRPGGWSRRLRGRADGQLPGTGQLPGQLRLPVRPRLGGAGGVRGVAQRTGSCHGRTVLLPRPRAAREALRLAGQRPRHLSGDERTPCHGPRLDLTDLGGSRGLHPVRFRGHHLCAASRGQHRGPDRQGGERHRPPGGSQRRRPGCRGSGIPRPGIRQLRSARRHLSGADRAQQQPQGGRRHQRIPGRRAVRLRAACCCGIQA
jgi:branched-subunit amino acid ABC-type transport system permease component